MFQTFQTNTPPESDMTLEKAGMDIPNLPFLEEVESAFLGGGF